MSSFAYGGEVDVLHDLDLGVEPGEIVAVCGPTGSGKTSLLNLLPRFYDPTGGRVLVGGVDTRDVPIAELRADVALVTQRPVLFSVPLRENLTGGREDADWDEVLAACEAAGVDSFGPNLPDGYDTLIGERGVESLGRPAPASRPRARARSPNAHRCIQLGPKSDCCVFRPQFQRSPIYHSKAACR